MPTASLQLAPIRSSTNGSLYRQIAANLQKQIAHGKFFAGTRLPPERALADKLRVNRLTLRQALHELELQGRLTRKHGSGWYIAEPVIERQAGKLISFTYGMQRRGYKPSAQIVRCVKRRVDAEMAQHLKLRAGARVYDLHRLRFINDEPVLLERFMIPVKRFPDLETHDLEHRSIYEVLRNEYCVKVKSARQSLEPVLAGKYEAKLLRVKIHAPLMLEKRLSFDTRGQPIEYGCDLYRGDRFRFVTEMASLEL